jgi:hypothetical protein
MQLARKILNDRNNSRRRTDDRIACNYKMAVPHGIENLPTWLIR